MKKDPKRTAAESTKSIHFFFGGGKQNEDAIEMFCSVKRFRKRPIADEGGKDERGSRANVHRPLPASAPASLG